MKRVIVNRENIDRLYSKLSYIDEYRGKAGYEYFAESLYEAELVLEFDWGLLRLTDYEMNSKIKAHGLFWNKGVFRDVGDFREAGDYVLNVFKVPFVYVVFPARLKALQRLMEKSCFKVIQVVQGALFDGIIKEDGIFYGYEGGTKCQV